ncbi:hypothetical protein ACC783_23660 [Rhizobium ruizarguesonis]
MSGPFIAPRTGQPLDLLEQSAAGGGWESLEQLIAPVIGGDLQPSDRVAKFLYALHQHGDGRELVEWLMDITMRLPWRVTGKTMEETAILAINRQAIAGVGEVILKVIAKGKELADAERNQNGAGT